MKGYSAMPISRLFSLIHAMIATSFALHILWTGTYADVWLIAHHGGSWPVWDTMFFISVCYLFTDLVCMILFPTDGDLEWIVHHIVGCAGLLAIWKTGDVWFVGLTYELSEMSTIFLNITWYLHKRKTHGWFFVLMMLCLLVTYFITRIVVGIFILYAYLTHHLGFIYSLPLWEVLFIIFGTLSITCLNVFWGVKLLRKLRDALCHPSSQRREL